MARLHSDFWDDYHLRYLRETDPSLHAELKSSSSRSQIGTAQFPVYMRKDGVEQTLLFRIKVQPITSEVDVVQGNCTSETSDYLLDVVKWFRPRTETTRVKFYGKGKV